MGEVIDYDGKEFRASVAGGYEAGNHPYSRKLTRLLSIDAPDLDSAWSARYLELF